ncbi:inositol polyphosphate 5-phosphatase [Ascosphaera aggregata]|nr:inositol polyphosphate 5-phosphatase [Ascosphaera aggregata]
MSTDPSNRRIWEDAVIRTLNQRSSERSTAKYVLLRSEQLVGAALLLFVKEDLLRHIKNVEGSDKKTGLSGMAGNKGGCAIRLELSNTHLCFVTAHLAAGFANYEERNEDYQTIAQGLRFQRNRSIDDHDSILWFGDFNYRIGMRDDDVRKLIKMGDLETLYENDQLNLQMMAGLTFPYYSEGKVTFPPTYKFDIYTDNYDTSEKARIPAWCDRVLWKGTNLRLLQYYAAPLMFSDHRPVYATFECTISVVDEQAKEEIRKEAIHRQKNSHTDIKAEEDDSEDLLDYDPIAPDLPPASSNRQRWWLDRGQPTRSRIELRNYAALDPMVNPNPFKQQKQLGYTLNSSSSTLSLPSRTSTSEKQASVPPPSRPTSRGKQPPPVPSKPPSMRSIVPGGRNGNGFTPDKQSQVSTMPLRSVTTMPAVPGPEEQALRTLKTNNMLTKQDHGKPHVVRQTTSLLDDDSDMTLSWKPLKPQ